MAKDYFEDITPPEEGEPRKIPLRSMSEQDDDPQAEGNDEMSAPKGIRSISASARNRARMPIDGRGAPASASTRPKSGKRWILWAVASIAVVVVAGLALLASLDTPVMEADELVFHGMDEADLDTLIRILERLRDQIEPSAD